MIEFFSDLRLDSTEFCRIEFFILRLALREKVILDLRLCSRRAYCNSRSVFEFENRHLLFGGQVAFDIFDRVRLYREQNRLRYSRSSLRRRTRKTTSVRDEAVAFHFR